MLKLTIHIVRAITATLLLTTASLAQQSDPKEEDFETLMGRAQVSCDNLVIVEYLLGTDTTGLYDKDSFIEDQHPVYITFDKSVCQEKIKQDYLKSYLGSFFKFLILEINNANYEEKTHEMQNELRKDLHSLIEFCKNSGPPLSQGKIRACFIGAPPTSASKPVISIFKEMVNNTRSDSELICAKDPITPEMAQLSEFKNFLEEGQKELSWTQIKKSTENDGFFVAMFFVILCLWKCF